MSTRTKSRKQAPSVVCAHARCYAVSCVAGSGQRYHHVIVCAGCGRVRVRGYVTGDWSTWLDVSHADLDDGAHLEILAGPDADGPRLRLACVEADRIATLASLAAEDAAWRAAFALVEYRGATNEERDRNRGAHLAKHSRSYETWVADMEARFARHAEAARGAR